MLIGQVSTDANTKRPAELTREYQGTDFLCNLLAITY
jgi:hypothetical protein